MSDSDEGPVSADLARKLRTVLLEADASFAATHDVMEALRWVAFAARHGLPPPPGIANWLAAAIDAYETSDGSLDQHLGLRGSGPGHPRLRLRLRRKRESALAEMHVLVAMLGSSVDDAAELVATLGEFTARTLREAYRRASLPSRAAEGAVRVGAKDVEGMLARYPDRLGVAVKQAKARIRFKHHV